jgi:serine/threonine-protein kinase SRPK3
MNLFYAYWNRMNCLRRPLINLTETAFIYLSHAMRPMFLTKGEPVLSDLGEARLSESHRGIIMPTLYRAPEVLLDMDWDNKVDIWGLVQTVIKLISPVPTFTNHEN